VIRFPGVQGKVHGSLARAGKVKGQTPKVEKQDKPKPPVGTWRRRTERFADGPASRPVQLIAPPRMECAGSVSQVA